MDQKKYKINLHILEACNYSCRHCFSHFDSGRTLSVDEWKQIVDNCRKGINVCEYNIAGGEPLMYRKLPELVRYIKQTGADCSIITNGFLMTDEWIKENAALYKTIGFSIDSFNPETLIRQGRCNAKGEILTGERLKHICEFIKECNPECKIKINTVVTKLNLEENISKIIEEFGIPVDRWKILKIKRFSNNAFSNDDICISDSEFDSFVKRNTGFLRPDCANEVIVEHSMSGAYIIIDANGYLLDNSRENIYTPVLNCLTEDFAEGFEKYNLNKELYFSRYAN